MKSPTPRLPGICTIDTQWRSQPKPDARAPLIPHATNLNVEPTFMKAHAKMPNLFGHTYMQYF